MVESLDESLIHECGLARWVLSLSPWPKDSVKGLLRDGPCSAYLSPIYLLAGRAGLSNLPASSGSHPKCRSVMAYRDER